VSESSQRVTVLLQPMWRALRYFVYFDYMGKLF